MSAPFPSVRFAGLRFTPMTVEASVRALAERPAQAPLSAFVTPNAEHAWLRRRDAEFAACGDTCFISTNDSRILGRAARLGGLELHFAPGAYVVRALFDQVIKPDTALTVIGGAEPMIADLRAQYGLTNLKQHIPPMGFINKPDAVDEAIAFVAANPARFIFVAMGPPQSEKFCQRLIADGRATGLALCIGSSLTVLTGAANPAPDWMEHSGLVWLYRLATEPKRLWKRYLVRGMFGLGLALRDALRLRLGLLKPTHV
ncbi:WecB/TagA/CpsF family glycosyltransferase [Caulobacter sp. NIBR2454]|uniref:WecB/TagA/CpsF family glycosyltransferase n=1 Tax=Caulobacter sp. NIBR2454 TaxID=3015996 RepID=UPI0022B6200F|nr:WecB/TagA/CpsF family glycosyltransferase [Caulobacter sp. NIBR2454]